MQWSSPYKIDTHSTSRIIYATLSLSHIRRTHRTHSLTLAMTVMASINIKMANPSAMSASSQYAVRFAFANISRWRDFSIACRALLFGNYKCVRSRTGLHCERNEALNACVWVCYTAWCIATFGVVVFANKLLPTFERAKRTWNTSAHTSATLWCAHVQRPTTDTSRRCVFGSGSVCGECMETKRVPVPRNVVAVLAPS